MLKQFANVFTWNESELECCFVGEFYTDTQKFPPCKTIFNRLSFWEELEVNNCKFKHWFLWAKCALIPHNVIAR
jgi:hypothetical protein